MDKLIQIWISTKQVTGPALSKANEQTDITKAGAADTYKRRISASRTNRDWDNFRFFPRIIALAKFADPTMPAATLLNHYCSGLF